MMDNRVLGIRESMSEKELERRVKGHQGMFQSSKIDVSVFRNEKEPAGIVLSQPAGSEVIGQWSTGHTHADDGSTLVS